MPEEMERKLWAEANSHSDWSDERKRKYVYGTMRKSGWKPEREKKHHYKSAKAMKGE